MQNRRNSGFLIIFFPVMHLLWKIGYDVQVAATNIKRVSYTMNKAGQ